MVSIYTQGNSSSNSLSSRLKNGQLASTQTHLPISNSSNSKLDVESDCDANDFFCFTLAINNDEGDLGGDTVVAFVELTFLRDAISTKSSSSSTLLLLVVIGAVAVVANLQRIFPSLKVYSEISKVRHTYVPSPQTFCLPVQSQ
jgi:hypothetical protein